jgi:hypothetical protein
MSEIPQWQHDRLDLLADACEDAGVAVSMKEWHTLLWLAGWEQDTVEAIAGLIRRAGENGKVQQGQSGGVS